MTADDPLVAGRDSCRRAYIFASALTGSVQLLSLVLSPLIGYAASSSTSSRRTRHPQAALLGGASLLGAVAFVGYSALPNDGDPRSGLTWLYAVGVGFAQAAGVVLSLALLTTGRGMVTARSDDGSTAAGGREIAGTLSGAYGFSGGEPVPSAYRAPLLKIAHLPLLHKGLGILAVGASAGFGFDKLWPGAPFALMAVIDLAVAVGAAALYRRS